MSREIGDIEDDLSFVDVQLDELIDRITELQSQRKDLLLEMKNVDTWSES